MIWREGQPFPVPEYLVEELTETACIEAELDERMEGLRHAIHGQENGPKKSQMRKMLTQRCYSSCGRCR